MSETTITSESTTAYTFRQKDAGGTKTGQGYQVISSHLTG